MARDPDEGIYEYGPVYRAIERALWALGPPLLLLLVINTRSTQEVRQLANNQIEMAIAAENAEYCVKWGMPAESDEHANCIRDLVGIRARSEQRVRDAAVADSSF